MMQFLRSNIKFLIFCAFALLIVLYHFIGFQTHYGYYDLMHARMANDLLNGNLLLDDCHFAYRWSILSMTALSYMMFGITDLASALPAMLISIITLFLVHTPQRRLDRLSGAGLKDYVWNRGGEAIFVDDFEIEVFRYPS